MDARSARESDPGLPPVLFVYQGTAEDGRDFFPRFDPEARAVADGPRTLYRAFGLERGGLKQMFAPRVWACGVRAARKGVGLGKPSGDPWQMPGFFLVDGDRVVWEHRPKHAADHPDFATLPRIMQP